MMAVPGSIDTYLARRGCPQQEARIWNAAARRDPKRLFLPPIAVRSEANGAQPGVVMPFFAPLPDAALDVDAAITVIRAARGVGPDRPCLFPHDLGCETQLYLGLAVRAVRCDWRAAEVAEACRVARPDALFFDVLLGLAAGAAWLKPGILDAACAALTRGGVA